MVFSFINCAFLVQAVESLIEKCTLVKSCKAVLEAVTSGSVSEGVKFVHTERSDDGETTSSVIDTEFIKRPMLKYTSVAFTQSLFRDTESGQEFQLLEFDTADCNSKVSIVVLPAGQSVEGKALGAPLMLMTNESLNLFEAAEIITSPTSKFTTPNGPSFFTNLVSHEVASGCSHNYTQVYKPGSIQEVTKEVAEAITSGLEFSETTTVTLECDGLNRFSVNGQVVNSDGEPNWLAGQNWKSETCRKLTVTHSQNSSNVMVWTVEGHQTGYIFNPYGGVWRSDISGSAPKSAYGITGILSFI